MSRLTGRRKGIRLLSNINIVCQRIHSAGNNQFVETSLDLKVSFILIECLEFCSCLFIPVFHGYMQQQPSKLIKGMFLYFFQCFYLSYSNESIYLKKSKYNTCFCTYLTSQFKWLFVLHQASIPKLKWCLSLLTTFMP